jgi:predicted ester cyclase
VRSALERLPPDPLAEAWQAGWTGAAGFAACCTGEVQYEDPLAAQPLRGVGRLEEHAARLREAFPDLRLERAGRRLGDDEHACLAWRALGTHSGPLGTLPPTGRFVVLHGVHYVELVDGLVGRARGFFDLYDASVQLGLLPARGSLAESAMLLLRGFGLRSRP